MPTELRSARRLAFACASLLLSACGAVVDSSPTASGQVRVTATARAAASAPTAAATTASPSPTAVPSAQGVYVSEAQEWTIVVPPGWEVVAQRECCLALLGGKRIGEVLVSPASGLTLEQLARQTVEDLSAWPGAADVEAERVRLPAGDAVRATLRTTSPDTGPGVFVLYVIEERDRRYAISVRGPQDDGELLADAEALAESFAILE